MSPPVPLDDFSPSVRAAVLKLRGQDLDPATVEAIAEVMWAVMTPRLAAHMEMLIVKKVKARETKSRALTARLKAEINLGGHLKTGQLWTGQNRPVREPPQAQVL